MSEYTTTIVIPWKLLVKADLPRVMEWLDIWCDISDAAVDVETEDLFTEWSRRLTLAGPAEHVRPINTRIMTWMLAA